MMRQFNEESPIFSTNGAETTVYVGTKARSWKSLPHIVYEH